MKKIYMTPDMEIVKIQTMQMMASSLVLDDDPGKVVDDVNDLLAPAEDFDFSDDLNEFEDYE